MFHQELAHSRRDNCEIILLQAVGRLRHNSWRIAIVVGVDGENPPITPQKNLDPFDPANGFSTTGNSNYSNDFVKRYTAAQSDRMNDWIEQALHIRAETAQGKWRFPDDDSIVIARGGGSVAGGGASAAIFVPDIRQQCCTTQPEKLMMNDGSIVSNKIVQSVRLPNPTNAPGNPGGNIRSTMAQRI